jgi:glycosyltransferase involved in cell wall biosynthesis
MSEPTVSVIVPVRNRRALLRKTLDALAAQTYSDFEVVVVDDGSDDGSDKEAIADAEAGRPVRVVYSGGAGAVGARTAGVDAARGHILAFTDSDCEPTPAWLAATVAVVEAGVDLAHGPTQPARAMRPLERSLWSGHEGLYPTCNIVLRRTAFDAVGGFELRHEARGSGEDTVLGWRVRRMGRVAFVPEALVYHAVLPFELRDAIRRTWAIGDFPALTREVPELRGMPLFRHGVSLGKFHRLPLYATAIAFVLRRRNLAALAGAWWVWSKLRELRDYDATTAEQLRALPVELALDVVTVTALAVGSVRSRTLVI